MASAPIPRPADCDWAWRPEGWRLPLAMPELGPESGTVASGARLGAELELFHDAAAPALSLRQIRSGGAVPFLLALETAGFDGSFLSLALTLPATAVHGLRRRHILRLNLLAEAEGLGAAYARLNLRHGPNVAQLLRPLPLARPEDCPRPAPPAPPLAGSLADTAADPATGASGGPSDDSSVDRPGGPRSLPGPAALSIDFDLQQFAINEARLDLVWLDLILERPATGHLRLHDLTLTRRPRAEV